MLVYDRHNYTAVSPFYYWVTNRIINNQVVDRYWNTKQKIGQPDSVDAESLEVAKFKDGRYWVKVVAADIRNNADTDFQIPKSNLPRIRQVARRMAGLIPNNFQNSKFLKVEIYKDLPIIFRYLGILDFRHLT
uniref:Uncharacterized protein n=1 Tax=candidate division WOR-3 bacterium TaxID=2052148 RepID=A0A7V3VT66_UNCW3